MIARKTWRELWLLALIYGIVMEAILVPPILLWEEFFADFQKSQLAGKLLGRWAKTFVQAMTSGSEPFAFKWFSSVQIFFRGANICGIAAAVLFGTGIIARERENQTLEFMLSRPIHRSRILWSKFWVTAVLLVLPLFATCMSTNLVAAEVGQRLSYGHLFAATLHVSVFVLAIFALTTLCSVWAQNQLHAAAAIGTFVVIQATIYFVPGIRGASMFQLSDYELYGAILTNKKSLPDMLTSQTIWIAAAGVLFYVLADWRFRKSEL